MDVLVNIWMFIYGCYVWMCKCAKRAKHAERAKCAKRAKRAKCAKCLVVVCLLEMNILQLSHCRPPYGARFSCSLFCQVSQFHKAKC